MYGGFGVTLRHLPLTLLPPCCLLGSRCCAVRWVPIWALPPGLSARPQNRWGWVRPWGGPVLAFLVDRQRRIMAWDLRFLYVNRGWPWKAGHIIKSCWNSLKNWFQPPSSLFYFCFYPPCVFLLLWTVSIVAHASPALLCSHTFSWDLPRLSDLQTLWGTDF